ncbi:FxLYD domain-containing protein [Natronococcus sp. A-GB7]|uniref:FxLYD domain-containing protein n=1 Tax=Natronococcus sp. A-GB7 TaxID=3037649 RepID=UPI00241F3F32|nr:FxLYD domain-containing protein [Natronococcus sp. A-GB7]MDG5817348.1 FxLYD domain-containing protein [Natronococcus sp. A-GB7]
MHRRTVLFGTSVAVSALLAGCASEDGDETDDDTEVGADDGEETETDDTNGDDDANGDGGNGDDDSGEDEEADENGDDETDEDETDDLEERIEEGPPIEGLALEEHELVEDDLSASVEGVVVNESGEDVRSVRVGIVFYDADGERIDDATPSTSELADEEEWAFSAMTLEEGIASYAIGIVEAEPVERTPL